MKNKISQIPVLLLVLLITLFAFSTTACDGGKNLNSADELKAYLDSLPVNSPDKPIKVAMKANDAMLKDIKEVLLNTDKYVSLDLSGSPLTEIPNKAFYYDETVITNAASSGSGEEVSSWNGEYEEFEYVYSYDEDEDYSYEEKEYVYKGCKTLVGIIIPKGVTSIGNQAFDECINLKSVTIPNSVTSIEECAFQDCTSLTSITIPNSVTSIGFMAFDNSGLTSVTIPNSVTSIGGRAFEGTSLKSITIPNSVTSIGEYAFYGCNITSLTIPNSVTSIRGRAFCCEALTSVTFQGTIASNMFGTDYWGSFSRPFYGDLSDKYLAEGIGTYTTTAPVKYDSTWTKQNDDNNKSSSSTRSNVGGGRNINSADALKTYLDKQPANSPDKPIKVAMKANDAMLKSIAKIINDAGKYVSLDLSGSPLTTIPGEAFGHNQYTGCKMLVGIIIPNSVNRIEFPAFSQCPNLVSVTFQSIIASNNFNNSFDGDLEDKYLAGGIGTYTTTAPVGYNSKWTKQ